MSEETRIYWTEQEPERTRVIRVLIHRGLSTDDIVLAMKGRFGLPETVEHVETIETENLQ